MAGETSLDLARTVGETETTMDRLVVVEGKATTMDLVSLAAGAPTKIRQEEDTEDTAGGRRRGGGWMEVDGEAQLTTGREQRDPPERAGTSTASNPS